MFLSSLGAGAAAGAGGRGHPDLLLAGLLRGEGPRQDRPGLQGQQAQGEGPLLLLDLRGVLLVGPDDAHNGWVRSQPQDFAR